MRANTAAAIAAAAVIAAVVAAAAPAWLLRSSLIDPSYFLSMHKNVWLPAPKSFYYEYLGGSILSGLFLNQKAQISRTFFFPNRNELEKLLDQL